MSTTDPFLALFKQMFWTAKAPDLKGGIFTAYWALQHACDINPGGINHPIRIAVLTMDGLRGRARFLNDDELAETKDLVGSAIQHMGSFREILLGNMNVVAPPSPPRAS